MRLLDRIIGLIAGIGTRNPPVQPMHNIPDFPAEQLPKEAMDRFTKDINTLIDEYNSLTSVAEKRQILQKIQAKIQETDYKYSPCDIAHSMSYRRVHASLFQAIKYQYASLGRPSLVESPGKSSHLSEVIANMSPDKADELLGILDDSAFYALNSKLNSLYPISDLSTEARDFRQFLSTHQITYLGGGNSSNFKVTRLRDNSHVVLKIDNRLDTPRRVEAHLRAELGDCFAKIDAERQVSCIDEEGTRIGRTLIVTEYCSGGDAGTYGAHLSTDDKEKKAAPLFEQMAAIMLRIQEQRCIFPDAKITNWLVDGDNKLCIADTKSFLFTDNKGDYYSDIPGNEYCDFIQTKAFTPPEFYNPLVNAENCHAFILGKNLYNFLTDEITNKNNGADFDFDYPIFKRPLGSLYRDLIVGLIKPQAAARMNIKEAQNQLFIISNPDFIAVFTELNYLKFGAHDEQMNDFIRKKQQQITNSSPEEKETILRELENTVLALKADMATSYVRDVIKDFRERAGLFTIGMNAKAVRIETAMSQLSIEDRCNLLASDDLTEVMKAMASHRHLGKRGDVYLTERGQIITNDAAQTFKDFKIKFGNQIPYVDDTPEVNYNRFNR